MTMYRCSECGHVFEQGEESTWREPHGEEMVGCPVCKGHYDEVEPCKICGTYDHDAGEEYCDDCKVMTQRKFAAMMLNNFTRAEKDLLNILYEGESF